MEPPEMSVEVNFESYRSDFRSEKMSGQSSMVVLPIWMI